VSGKTLRLWDAHLGIEMPSFTDPKAHLPHQSGWPAKASLLTDARTVAASFFGSHDLVFLDIVTGRIAKRVSDKNLGSWLALSSDGNLFVSHAAQSRLPDRSLFLWDVSTGKLLRRLRLRDPATGQDLDPKREINKVDKRDDCYAAAFSPDGKTVALGIDDGSIRLCDVATGQETCRLFHEGDRNRPVHCLAFSADGRFLATGGAWSDHAAVFWDLGTGKALRIFKVPPELPFRASVKPLSAQQLRKQRLVELRNVMRPSGGAYAIALSPDARVLATSHDKTYLWDVATGQLLHQLYFTTSQLAFSSTGLLATSEEGMLLQGLADGELAAIGTGEARAALKKLNSRR
jgi:WD40 repeat protein